MGEADAQTKKALDLVIRVLRHASLMTPMNQYERPGDQPWIKWPIVRGMLDEAKALLEEEEKE